MFTFIVTKCFTKRFYGGLLETKHPLRFSGALAKLQKAKLDFHVRPSIRLSIRVSVRMEQLDSQWTEFE